MMTIITTSIAAQLIASKGSGMVIPSDDDSALIYNELTSIVLPHNMNIITIDDGGLANNESKRIQIGGGVIDLYANDP